MKVLMINDFENAGGAENHAKLLKKKLEEIDVTVAMWIAEPEQDRGSWRKARDKFKPDIIHLHNWALLIRDKATRELFDGDIPVVMSLHDYLIICLKRMRLHNWKRCPTLCDNACGLAAESLRLTRMAAPATKVSFNPHSARIFSSNGVGNRVITHGIEIEDWPFNGDRRTRVGFTCAHQAYWWKGEAEAREICSSLGLEPVVLQRGVSRQEVSDFYHSIEVLLLPTIFDETFGLVIAEAMASGTVVVSYDNAGARALIDHGETGYLAPMGDRYALTRCVTRALKSDNSMMKEKARAQVEEYYTADRMAREWENLYDNLR